MSIPQPQLNRWLFYSALGLLLIARLLIHLIPFNWIIRWIERPLPRAELEGETRVQARRGVSLAVSLATIRLGWQDVCLPRALAAHAMLRQMGVSTIFYVGATSRVQAGLRLHVWLQDGDAPVIGKQAAQGFHPIASYTPRGGTSHPVVIGQSFQSVQQVLGDKHEQLTRNSTQAVRSTRPTAVGQAHLRAYPAQTSPGRGGTHCSRWPIRF